MHKEVMYVLAHEVFIFFCLKFGLFSLLLLVALFVNFISGHAAHLQANQPL